MISILFCLIFRIFLRTCYIIYWYVLYNFWKYLFVKIAARVLGPDHIVTSLKHLDIQNSIHISLKTCLQKQNTKHTTATQHTKSVKWNDNKRDDFVNMVHNQHNELTYILGDLENLL
jgi:hypothetical protein